MEASGGSVLDLDAYFARIGYTGETRTTVETLRAIHLAHGTHIPFENLDIHLGRSIRIDLESVQAKLVRDQRGGYCFEQNTLLAAALERLGFPVTRLAARVRLGSDRVLPRTHKLLMVEAEGISWIADVGFGASGLLEPIPLEAGVEHRQGDWTFQLAREETAWVLQCPGRPLGADQYAFTLEPQLPIDFVLANHYTSTHPDSRFTQTLTAQRQGLHERLILRNRDFTRLLDGVETAEKIADDAELLRVLAQDFGLRFPAGTLFRPPVFAQPAV